MGCHDLRKKTGSFHKKFGLNDDSYKNIWTYIGMYWKSVNLFLTLQPNISNRKTASSL